MTPSARIAAVTELLAEVMDAPRPADGVASAYFRARRFIGSKDRAAVAQMLYDIMRRYHRLLWHAGRAGVAADARALVIAALVLGGEYDAAAVARVFSGDKYAPAPLTPAEKALAAALEGRALDDPAMDPRVRAECPPWAFAPLQAALGESFGEEMRAMQDEAPLDLRVNILLTDRDAVLERLRRDGIEAEAGRISPWCVRLRGRPAIARHALFTSGHVEIQDQGSQMVAVMADAKPGEQVADFCAGAGGKTLALGAMMNNKGRIVATDVLDRRLARAKLRFRRAGLHNVETRALASERDRFVKRHKGHFDLVLVDAPCTGTGTWRRDPDKRWKTLGPGLAELVRLQKDILESAQRMVKPGGRLVYATCSLLPEENSAQVRAFTQAHPEFTLRDEMRLTPARDDTDGFYAAVLGRAHG